MTRCSPNMFPVFWIFAFFVRFSLIFTAFNHRLKRMKVAKRIWSPFRSNREIVSRRERLVGVSRCLSLDCNRRLPSIGTNKWTSFYPWRFIFIFSQNIRNENLQRFFTNRPLFTSNARNFRLFFFCCLCLSLLFLSWISLRWMIQPNSIIFFYWLSRIL